MTIIVLMRVNSDQGEVPDDSQKMFIQGLVQCMHTNHQKLLCKETALEHSNLEHTNLEHPTFEQMIVERTIVEHIVYEPRRAYFNDSGLKYVHYNYNYKNPWGDAVPFEF